MRNIFGFFFNLVFPLQVRKKSKI